LEKRKISLKKLEQKIINIFEKGGRTEIVQPQRLHKIYAQEGYNTSH
jgi:hypothetical protein